MVEMFKEGKPPSKVALGLMRAIRTFGTPNPKVEREVKKALASRRLTVSEKLDEETQNLVLFEVKRKKFLSLPYNQQARVAETEIKLLKIEMEKERKERFARVKKDYKKKLAEWKQGTRPIKRKRVKYLSRLFKKHFGDMEKDISFYSPPGFDLDRLIKKKKE
jgi:hypothetical protein